MNKLVLSLIKQYQNNKNPNYKNCRYTPTCSSYAYECFQKFGFFKAMILSVYRIIRCNPLSKGGYDPTPLSFVQKTMKNIEDLTK